MRAQSPAPATPTLAAAGGWATPGPSVHDTVAPLIADLRTSIERLEAAAARAAADPDHSAAGARTVAAEQAVERAAHRLLVAGQRLGLWPDSFTDLRELVRRGR